MDFSNDQQISSDGNFENFSEDTQQKEEISGNGQAEGDLSLVNSDNKAATVDDDAADDSRKIFVGGIHHEATEKELIDYFNSFGKVRKCIIKVDKFTGHSRGFGFVVFEEEESVQKTLDHPEHKLRNKKIEPKRAKPSREPQKKIFVGGIDPEVTEEQIKEYFGQFGKIESLDLPFDSHRQKRKAYIFVGYSTEVEARKACEKEKQDIFGKRCDVRIAVQKEQLQKQKGPWGSWHNQGGYGNYGNYGYGYDQNYGYPGYDYNSSYNYGAPAPGYGAPNYGNTTGGYDYNNYSGYSGYDYGYNYGHGGYGGGGSGSTRGGYGGGGKMGRGRGSSGANSSTTGTGGGFHPYNR